MNESNDPNAAPQAPDPTPFHSALWNAWADLLRPRRRVLLRHYGNAIQTIRPDAPRPETLAEARQMWDAVHEHPVPSEFDREAAERKWVLAVRMISGWIVCWSTLLPVAFISTFCIRHALHGPLWPRLLIDGVIGLVLFPLLCVLGLIAQALLIRPFLAVMNWLLS